MLSVINSYLQTFTVATIGGIIGGGAAWLAGRLLEHIFATRLEDRRHANAIVAQKEKTRARALYRRFDIFSSIFDYYEAMIFWTEKVRQNSARQKPDFFARTRSPGSYFRRSPE